MDMLTVNYVKWKKKRLQIKTFFRGQFFYYSEVVRSHETTQIMLDYTNTQL